MIVRTGEVEGAKCSGEILSIDFCVNGSPIREWLSRDIRRWTSDGSVENSGNAQDRITERLEIESPSRHAAEQSIVGIGCGNIVAGGAALSPRCGCHDVANQLLA